MRWLTGKLKAWHLLPSYTADEVINAEHEDNLRAIKKTADLVHVAREKRLEGTRTLKRALARAQEASAWQDVDALFRRAKARGGE